MSEVVVGRRERKKAQTRHAIADAAMALFLQRGFHEVTVAEIADLADVSVSTVFQHFPTKEALAFEDDQAIEDALVHAVTERPPGTPLLHAIRDAMITTPDGSTAGPSAELVALVARTPALRIHSEQLWLRYAEALTAAIANETGRDARELELRALARYIVQAPSIARQEDDPAAAIRTVFDHLEHGWNTLLRAPPSS